MLKQQPRIRNLLVLLTLATGLVACQGSSESNSNSATIPVAPQGTWMQYSASGLGGGNELLELILVCNLH